MRRIIFKKPNLKRLKQKGYFCVDMHIHSDYSVDSSNSIKKIVERANEFGIGISIADHNEIKGAIEASKYDIFLIPAIEVTTLEEFHLLFYFCTISQLKNFYRKIIVPNKKDRLSGSSKLNALHLIEQAKRFNCLVVFAHPYRILSKTSFRPGKKRLQLKKIYKNVDIIEVFNSKNFKLDNRRSLKMIKRKGFIGGSDAHNLSEIGTTVTCTKSGTVKGFLDEVKKRKNIVVGKEVSFSHKIPIIIYYLRKVYKKLIKY